MHIPDDAIARVVREWVVRAEEDWITAIHVLKLGKDCPNRSVCFHAQQCVEKYIKAILSSRRTPFPKTHDIEELIALLPALHQPPIRIQEQSLLTIYAVSARYPGDEEPISLTEARKAVAIVRRVRHWAQKRI
jgi:HEPN domain-containing protein